MKTKFYSMCIFYETGTLPLLLFLNHCFASILVHRLKEIIMTSTFLQSSVKLNT